MVPLRMKNPTTTQENNNNEDKKTFHEKSGLRGRLEKFPWVGLFQRVEGWWEI